MPPVLEVTNVAKAFRSVGFARAHAVEDVSLRLDAGEVLGLLGPNGAGKSTTLRMVAGLVRPDRGRVVIDGHDLGVDRLAAQARAGFLIEGPALPAELSCQRALAYLARLDGGGAARIAELLAEVGLTDAADKLVKHLSLGMKQRLGLAAALLARPRLLVLDEPMNGLDPTGIREIGDLLRRLAAAGTAVLLSSHLLDEVERVADRVAVMWQGKVAGDVAVRRDDKGALARLYFGITEGGGADRARAVGATAQ